MLNSKKIITTVLLGCSIIGISNPAFAADYMIAETPITPMIENGTSGIQPRSSSYKITGNYVSLRASASLSGDVVAYLMKGDIVADLKETKYSDGHLWVMIQCVNCSNSILNGTPGWIASDYLSLIG